MTKDEKKCDKIIKQDEKKIYYSYEEKINLFILIITSFTTSKISLNFTAGVASFFHLSTLIMHKSSQSRLAMEVTN